MTAASIIYNDTEYMIENNTEENDYFVRKVASGLVEENEIIKWFENHIIRSKI